MERQKNLIKVMVFSPKNISQGRQRPKRMQLEPKVLAALKDSRTDPTQRVVEGIMRVGPRNAALLSRLTGIPTETVRYKIKRQLKEMGFRIHADVDYQRLGLRLHWATVDFTPTYSDLAVQILLGLHGIGYLVYYARIIPQGHYVALFALPEGSSGKYHEFLKHLIDLRIIRDYSLEDVVWSRHLSMNPKYFNFDSGKWDMDWRKVESEKVTVEGPTEPQEKAEVDKADLLLVKELQKDSIQSVIDIARKVKIHPKTLRYHYHTHVTGRKLIPRYLVRWMKDIESTRAHSISFLRFRFKELNEAELMTAQYTIRRIPFTWVEYLTRESMYMAEASIPVEHLLDTLSYVSQNLAVFGRKLEIDHIDPSIAAACTIPYNLFDQEQGWILNVEDVKKRFTNLESVIQSEKK